MASRISIASAKAKGRALQKKVRDAFLALHPTLTCDDVRSCPMGSSGADIQLSSHAQNLIPFDIECKKAARGFTKLYDGLVQARRSNVRTPLLITEQDRCRALATMYFDDHLQREQKLLEANARIKQLESELASLRNVRPE